MCTPWCCTGHVTQQGASTAREKAPHTLQQPPAYGSPTSPCTTVGAASPVRKCIHVVCLPRAWRKPSSGVGTHGTASSSLMKCVCGMPLALPKYRAMTGSPMRGQATVTSPTRRSGNCTLYFSAARAAAAPPRECPTNTRGVAGVMEALSSSARRKSSSVDSWCLTKPLCALPKTPSTLSAATPGTEMYCRGKNRVLVMASV